MAYTTKNLNKKVQELISTATTKQKAVVLCRDVIDQNTRHETPLLTDEEARAIRDSVPPTEAKEFNKWIRCYNVYADLAPIAGLALSEYRERANDVVGYLNIAETLEQEENHLNAIFEDLKETGSQKALTAFGKSLESMKFHFADLERDEEGYIRINTDKVLELAREKMKEAVTSLSCLKAFIEALDEWTDRRKSKKFMPQPLLDSIEGVRTDTAIVVAPPYSAKVLQKKIEQGHVPTIAESKKAIFPYYAQYPSDEMFLDLWRDKIKFVEDNYKKNG